MGKYEYWEHSTLQERQREACIHSVCHQVNCVWAFVIGTRTSSIPLAGHVTCSLLRTAALTANSEIHSIIQSIIASTYWPSKTSKVITGLHPASVPLSLIKTPSEDVPLSHLLLRMYRPCVPRKSQQFFTRYATFKCHDSCRNTLQRRPTSFEATGSTTPVVLVRDPVRARNNFPKPFNWRIQQKPQTL
jgi:hypothetical protein